MGNSSMNYKNTLKYSILNQQKWKTIQNQENQNTLQCQQYKLNENLQEVFGQSYDLQLSRLQQEFQVYQIRKDNIDCLVGIYQVKTLSKPGPLNCCGSNIKVKVIVQKILYRLSDLGQLSQSQSCYILSQILKAITILKSYLPNMALGIFHSIQQQMVCINTFGQCKLWINQELFNNKINFYQNYNKANDNFYTKQQEISIKQLEIKTINHVIQMICKRTSLNNDSQFKQSSTINKPKSFYQYMKNQYYQSSQQALNLILKFVKNAENIIQLNRLRNLPNLKSKKTSIEKKSYRTPKKYNYTSHSEKSSLKRVKRNTKKHSLKKFSKNFQFKLDLPSNIQENIYKQQIQKAFTQKKCQKKTENDTNNTYNGALISKISRSSTKQGLNDKKDKSYKNQTNCEQIHKRSWTDIKKLKNEEQKMMNRQKDDKKFIKVLFSPKINLKKKSILNLKITDSQNYK